MISVTKFGSRSHSGALPELALSESSSVLWLGAMYRILYAHRCEPVGSLRDPRAFNADCEDRPEIPPALARQDQ
jgi:hypothetical protein